MHLLFSLFFLIAIFGIIFGALYSIAMPSPIKQISLAFVAILFLSCLANLLGFWDFGPFLHGR